ncbi:hypothetical protein SAMCCGM7_pB0266 (plasmid) [Sinorhizobium americanum CCGM7]|nr:hypothetical protein SAMCCGM7_pB0266 [Sinorhizobium americanum CCGM7]
MIALPDERAGYRQGSEDDDERSACGKPTGITQDERERCMNNKNPCRQQPPD